MTTPKPRAIHAFGALGEALRDSARSAFPDREYRVWTSEEEFVAGIEEVEVLLAFHTPRGHWTRAHRLRLIQMVGAGVDAVLPAPDLPEPVLLANARGVHEPEMSEFVLALILALAKHLPRAMAQQREHEWTMFGTRRLSGTTLGVLGLGTIGRAVAKRGAALGMRVIGTKRNPEPLAEVDEVLPPSDTRRVLEQSDVVVVILPRTPETEGLLDAEAIAAMRPGAQLVNVARGGIVDEAALAKALREGTLGGAAFDVFEEEPLPPSSPLWDTPNLLITPHTVGVNREYMVRLGEVFFGNVRRLERGEPLLNPVDREKGY
jgi:phosphoglycerate dehydrogenase-like enzyme